MTVESMSAATLAVWQMSPHSAHVFIVCFRPTNLAVMERPSRGHTGWTSAVFAHVMLPQASTIRRCHVALSAGVRGPMAIAMHTAANSQ